VFIRVGWAAKPSVGASSRKTLDPGLRRDDEKNTLRCAAKSRVGCAAKPSVGASSRKTLDPGLTSSAVESRGDDER
jgi:hypothetical protein